MSFYDELLIINKISFNKYLIRKRVYTIVAELMGGVILSLIINLIGLNCNHLDIFINIGILLGAIALAIVDAMEIRTLKKCNKELEEKKDGQD